MFIFLTEQKCYISQLITKRQKISEKANFIKRRHKILGQYDSYIVTFKECVVAKREKIKYDTFCRGKDGEML